MSESRPPRGLPLFIALLVWLAAAVPPAGAAGPGLLLTEDLQLKIADTFLEQGDYYRAVTEYSKLLILFPDSEYADAALLKIGTASVRGEEYRDAQAALTTLRERFPRSAHAAAAWYLEGVSSWKLKQLERAGAAFADLAAAYPQSEYAPQGLAAGALVALEENRPAAAGERLRALAERYPDHPAPGRAQAALEILEGYNVLPRKSPLLAGTFSAVLPGSGYFYADHSGDGVTAFFINALFVAAEVLSLKEENYPLAAVVGVIGLPFYLGNIYGSARAAEKWNVGVRRETQGRLSLVLDVRF
ncbi:MAG: tetratricopeptide repeat protein [Candidatus Methylomirabilia bacterium]